MTIPFQNIRGLLFDKDGTLFDFNESWSDWAYRFVYKIAPDQTQAAHLADAIGFDLANRTFHPSSAVIAGTPDDTLDAVARALPGRDLDEVKELIVASSADDFQVSVTPLRPLFTVLRDKGLHLGIATNDAEHPALSHLEQNELTDLFPFVAGYDSGYGAKPEPGQMHGFLKQFDLRPEQAIMIGDSTHDLQAGRAANMYTIGVLTGVAGEDALAPLSDLVLPSIAVLPDLLP